MENHSALISIDALLEERMLSVNGNLVLPDYELAKIFEVSTKHLMKKVKANKERFPKDFLLEMKKDKREKQYAFSWGGIMQAAGLFRTKRAIQIHLQLIRCYTKGLDLETIIRLLIGVKG